MSPRRALRYLVEAIAGLEKRLVGDPTVEHDRTRERFGRLLCDRLVLLDQDLAPLPRRHLARRGPDDAAVEPNAMLVRTAVGGWSGEVYASALSPPSALIQVKALGVGSERQSAFKHVLVSNSFSFHI